MEKHRTFIPSAGTGGHTMMAWIVWNLGKAALGAIAILAVAYGLAEIGHPELWKAVQWVLSGDQPLVTATALAVSRVAGGAVYLLSGGSE